MEETGTAWAQISTDGGGGRGSACAQWRGGGGCYLRRGGVCIVSSEYGGRARLVASWPPAPDGCIIDAHPSSRAAGATGRVQCDGVGRDWDTALTAREGGINH